MSKWTAYKYLLLGTTVEGLTNLLKDETKKQPTWICLDKIPGLHYGFVAELAESGNPIAIIEVMLLDEYVYLFYRVLEPGQLDRFRQFIDNFNKQFQYSQVTVTEAGEPIDSTH